jgi:WD40 repeat protein
MMKRSGAILVLMTLAFIALCAGIASPGASLYAQLDPTQQQRTVDALVQSRFDGTATALASEQAMTATAAIQATVDTGFNLALTATSVAQATVVFQSSAGMLSQPHPVLSADNVWQLAPLMSFDLNPSDIYSLAWSPDGGTLAVAADSTIYLYDPTSFAAPPRILEGHTDTITGVAFNADGSLLASAGFDYILRLWSPGTGEGLRNRPLPVSSVAIAFHPVSGRLFEVNGNGPLASIDVESWQREVLTFGDNVTSNPDLVITDGGSFVSVFGNNSIRIYHSGTTGVALAEDSEGSSVEYVRVDQTLPVYEQGIITAVDVNSATEMIAVGLDSGGITFRRLEDGEALSAVLGNGDGITDLRFIPSGTLLATVTENGMLMIVSSLSETPIVVANQQVSNAPLQSVAFSPDGSLIAVGGEDGRLYFYGIPPE